ncbi:hypothetical protein ACHAXR_011741 [Thalassiosira sp. AJA248-18]
MSAALTSPVQNTKNFPETLFDIISSERYAHIIAWLPHGRGFIIHDKQRFASMILPMYFDGAKFTSFTRRLKRWSFVRVPRGPELGAYYNKNFVRDDPELAQKMRYRVDGQFDEDGKKGGSDDDEKEESEKTEEKQGEAEEESLPTSKMEHAKQEKKAKKKRDLPMPLPSELPKPAARKRAKPAAARRYPAVQFLRNHPANNPAAAAENMYPSGYPPMISPNDPFHPHPDERRLMEIEREMLLSRSMMPHGAPVPDPRLGPPSMGAIPRPMVGSGAMAHHPYYPAPAVPMTTQRMLEVQRAERILEAEHVLALERNHPSIGMAPPKVLTREEIMASAPQDMQSRFQPPRLPAHALPQPGVRPMALPVSYNPDVPSQGQPRVGEGVVKGGAGVARPIMMNQQEEEEFAEYLIMKRKGGVDLRQPSKR